jgi:hypothetical protein
MAVAQDPEAIAKAVRIAGYSSLGVGAASFLVAGVLSYFVDDYNKKVDSYIKDVSKSKPKLERSEYDKYNVAYKYSAWAMYGVGGLFTAAGIALTVVGFVHDFAGEDVEANNAMPKIDFNVTPEYQGMTMGWRF